VILLVIIMIYDWDEIETMNDCLSRILNTAACCPVEQQQPQESPKLRKMYNLNFLPEQVFPFLVNTSRPK
jgi:hypothetical protein